MDKVVARYRNGRVVKGFTVDFTPFQDRFHIVEAGAETPQLREILVAELKGVFFVKDRVPPVGVRDLIDGVRYVHEVQEVDSWGRALQNRRRGS